MGLGLSELLGHLGIKGLLMGKPRLLWILGLLGILGLGLFPVLSFYSSQHMRSLCTDVVFSIKLTGEVLVESCDLERPKQ